MRIKILLTAILVSLSVYLQAQTYLMNAASNNTTVTTCSGNLYDDGGAAGNYAVGQVFVITFTPATPGTSVKLDFTQWSCDDGASLEVFDGPNTASPSFGAFSNGFVTPIGLQIMASATNLTGQLTLRWTAGTVASPGFAATITCHVPCQTIYARIDSLTCVPPMVDNYIDICAGTPITFSAYGIYPQNNVIYPQSDGTSLIIWNFGNGVSDTGSTVTYTYPFVSGYDFSVTIIDSMGCGTANYEAARVRISDNPILGINFVPDMCMGDTANFITGTSAVSTIVINTVNGGASGELNLADTTYLPDGSGASYTSSLTYSVFPAGMTLANVSDLLGVCMNMEHSYLGDLRLSIICPNGQSVILKNYPGGNGTFLGEPIDNDAVTGPCVGYDYCFSSTPTYGTMVAEANSHTYTYTDCAGTTYTSHLYLPAGSYASENPLSGLLGCPLNGTWQISIVDNLASDNGYIFSWGLSLNPALIPGGWSYSVPIDSVTWTGPNIHVTSDSTAQIIPDSTGSGTYTYNATVWDAFGCSYDTTINVQVVASPNVNLGNDTVLCGNGLIYNLDAGPGDHFLWSTTATSQTIPVTTTGFYSVEVENYNAASTLTCADGDTVYVKVLALPSADLGADFCTNVPVTLDAGNVGFNYLWNTGAADTNQTLYVAQSGTYTVTVFEEMGYNCESVSDINVTYLPIPDISVGPDSTICRHHTININVTDTYGYLINYDYTYFWYPFARTDPYLTVSWLDPKVYPVIVEVTGCPGDVVSDTMMLTVEPCDLTIPNIITPNGDGKNDKFYIPNVEYYPNSTMIIYNRWGRKVFESTNYQGDWDGENCADGVYFWVFTINFGDRGNGTEYKQQNGNITILR